MGVSDDPADDIMGFDHQNGAGAVKRANKWGRGSLQPLVDTRRPDLVRLEAPELVRVRLVPQWALVRLGAGCG